MWAIIENSKVKSIESSSIAVKGVSGATYLNADQHDSAKLAADGVYKLIQATAPSQFHSRGNTTYNIDDTAGTVTEVVTWNYDLAAHKTGKRDELNLARDAAIAVGVTYNNNIFDSDPESRANIVGTVAAINAGIALPANFTWRTKDNQNVAMTDADMKALGGVVLDFVNTVYAKSWQYKASLDAATTFAEVSAIVWQ